MQPLLSVALTVIGKVPGTVGVPLKVPFANSVNPVGKVPEFNVKLTAPTPPVCVKVWLNGALTVPVATPGEVTVIGAQLTVNVKVLVLARPQLSVAVTVTVKGPIGPALVTVIIPVAVLTLNPPVKPGAVATMLAMTPLSVGTAVGVMVVPAPELTLDAE